MSNRLLVTFSGSCYDETTTDIVQNGPRLGTGEVLVYDDRWLTEHPFYSLNRWLFDHPHKRGCGWYAWKALVIMDALNRLNDGDVVLYLDADSYPINDLAPLFQRCDEDGGIMLFKATGHTNRAWCKRDCYVVMGQAESRYQAPDLPAGVARYALFQRGPWRAQQFLCEWLTYSVNPRATTFDPSVLAPELDGFREHRCEQAVLTLLAHKYGLKLYREPDQYGNADWQDRDLYPQLFVHDNRRPLESRQTTAPVEGSRYRNV